jgi:hypothetical protein
MLFKPHESKPWNPWIAKVFHRRGIIAEITAALLAVNAHLKQLRTHWSNLHD